MEHFFIIHWYHQRQTTVPHFDYFCLFHFLHVFFVLFYNKLIDVFTFFMSIVEISILGPE